ncbi:MAG: insulinase family protein [bacterium]|nr:insulinase family protein [bacterium]
MSPNHSRSALHAITLIGCTLALVLGSCAPPPNSDAGAVLLGVPDDPTISFRIWFKVGSQDDPPGKEGLANLTGELLAQGATTKSSYEEILEQLYPLASVYEVQVDKEMTILAGRTHVANLEVFFELLTDAYLHPAFNEDDFERLRSEQLNRLRTTLRYASDEELGKAALTELIFEGTGYRHPVVGTVAGLNAVTLEDVRRFYAAHYTRASTVVALGGGYPEDLVGRFEATLDDLPAGVPATPPAVEPSPWTGRQVLLVAKPDADASISFGFPIDLKRGERDFYALWIARSFLGEHRSSAGHLYQVIREIRGMNYGDYSYIEAFPQGGRHQMPPPNAGRRQQIFEVWIRTLPNAQAQFALRAAMRELKSLVDNGLTEEQFELSRSFISKYYLQYADNTDTRLGYAIDDRFYGIDGEGHLARFGERIPEITREEVNAAIKKYLQYDNVKIAIVTGEAEALRDALVNDTPSPITYESPKPPEVLEEDKVIATWPLEVAEDAVRIVAVEEIFEK